jgi:addiction module HigA family antidote
MARMHNPPHPGEIIRGQCLEPLGLSVTEAAKGLGVTRKALSELLNGHAGISPEMAIRLEKAFGSTAATWRRMQLEYDLWLAEQRAGDLKVTRFAAPLTPAP